MFLLSCFFLRRYNTELLVLLTPPKLAALAAFPASPFLQGRDLSLGVIFISSLFTRFSKFWLYLETVFIILLLLSILTWSTLSLLFYQLDICVTPDSCGHTCLLGPGLLVQGSPQLGCWRLIL